MREANSNMTHKELDSLATELGILENEDYPRDGEKKEKVDYINSHSVEEMGPKPLDKPEPKPLPARLHINQFLVSYPEITPMHKAGFTAFVGGKVWMREDEWKRAFESYFKR